MAVWFHVWYSSRRVTEQRRSLKKLTLMPKSKQQVNIEVARRGLVSVMNDTKWVELQGAIRRELSFGPPYQLKVVLNPSPEPEYFENDVHYRGDWSDECLSPFYAIEWVRVRPRFLRHRGRLISPEVQSVELEFLEIVRRYHIPHRHDVDTVWIYGYATKTGELIKNSEQTGSTERRDRVSVDNRTPLARRR